MIYPIIGGVFCAIGALAFIMGVVGGDLRSAVCPPLVFFSLAALFFWGAKKNREFLKKQGLEKKRYDELAGDFAGSVKNIFKK